MFYCSKQCNWFGYFSHVSTVVKPAFFRYPSHNLMKNILGDIRPAGLRFWLKHIGLRVKCEFNHGSAKKLHILVQWKNKGHKREERVKLNGNKNNIYIENHKSTDESFWIHNVNGGLGKLNPHRVYREQVV